MVELQLAREGVEAEVKGLSLARHTAESEGAAARGRAAGLEAACEAQASQIEMLTAHLTAARHRRVPPHAMRSSPTIAATIVCNSRGGTRPLNHEGVSNWLTASMAVARRHTIPQR